MLDVLIPCMFMFIIHTILSSNSCCSSLGLLHQQMSHDQVASQSSLCQGHARDVQCDRGQDDGGDQGVHHEAQRVTEGAGDGVGVDAQERCNVCNGQHCGDSSKKVYQGLDGSCKTIIGCSGGIRTCGSGRICGGGGGVCR